MKKKKKTHLNFRVDNDILERIRAIQKEGEPLTRTIEKILSDGSKISLSKENIFDTIKEMKIKQNEMLQMIKEMEKQQSEMSKDIKYQKYIQLKIAVNDFENAFSKNDFQLIVKVLEKMNKK